MMLDTKVPIFFNVDVMPEYGSVAITTGGDFTLLCLRCGGTKIKVDSCTTPFTRHTPAPATCRCNAPYEEAHEHMDLIQNIRLLLMDVQTYFRQEAKSTPESKQAREALHVAWDALSQLSGKIEGGML